MAIVARALAAAAVAAALAPAGAASPGPSFHEVAFVTLSGHGVVRSVPSGIDCPRTCRSVFVRGTHLRLRAVAAPGWRFTGFDGSWCNGRGPTCVFDLVSTHDCVGGACPVGAFGIRARFVRTS